MCLKNNGIGLKGDMPWPRIPKELKHFADVTTSKDPLAYSIGDYAMKSCLFSSGLTAQTQPQGLAKVNAVVMGRNTWDSLPAKFRPLPGRLNLVLSRTLSTVGTDENGMLEVSSSLEDALASLSVNPKVNEIFIIGGAQIYEEALKHEACKLVILTRIGKAFEADTFMPRIEETYTRLHVSRTYQHKDITYDFLFLGNRKLLSTKPELVPTRLMERYPCHAEMQYLEIIKDIIETGAIKDDRTGVGIVGKFGY